MFRRFPQHPERQAIHDEAHARPPLSIPHERGEVWHWTLSNGQHDALWPDAIDPSQRHHLIRFDNGILRFERHTEFVALTWAGITAPDDQLSNLISACPGSQLAGVRIIFRKNDDAPVSLFGDARIFGGSTIFGGVSVATDFQFDENGLVTYVVSGDFEDDFARGRLAKRLADIETYRMAALLALPVVRERMGDLERLEHLSSQVAKELPSTDAGGLTDDTALRDAVNRLSRVQAELGEMSEAVRFRISASRAYYDLVTDRLDSLVEKPIGQRQTLKGFIDHRLAPGMKTVMAFDRRLSDLSGQVANALALARTRLEMLIEMQNQSLLQSMEERARQQVHLSQAVEGLSVAAITYYAIGLLGYVLKAVPDFGVKHEYIMAGAIPVIALTVWRHTSKITKKIISVPPKPDADDA